MIERGVIMRSKLCILFMLAALAAAHVAAAADQPPKPGYCPRALKPLPRNVDRVVERIVKKIEPQFREKLLETKRENLVQFQEWESGIRNSLCLEAGNNDQLIRSACDGELCHPQTASMVIMEAVWDRLDSVQRVLRPEQRQLSANRTQLSAN
jgi:malate synthase